MLSLLVSLSVFHRADCFRFSEALGEIAGGGKTKNAGYLRKGEIRIRKQPLAFLDPAGNHVADGRNPIGFLENMRQVVFVDIGFLRQYIQRDRLLIMDVNVAPDRCALSAADRIGRG